MLGQRNELNSTERIMSHDPEGDVTTEVLRCGIFV